MAGEVYGAIYEAMVGIAAERVAAEIDKDWKVFVHEGPEWISIEPDISLGRSRETIEVLVLVTHTISERMSEKKFWRNAAELFQWKVQGPKPVRVVDVVLSSKFKPELKKVSESIMDAVLDLGETSHGKNLIKFARKNAKALGTTNEERTRKIEAATLVNTEIADAISTMADDLKNALVKTNENLDGLWKLERKLYKKTRLVPSAIKTNVRNGLSKLMIMDANLRRLVYAQIRDEDDIEYEQVPQYAFSLGLMDEDLYGARMENDEVRSVVELLGEEKCELLIKNVPPRMNQYIGALRSPENNQHALDFLISNYMKLIKPGGMRKTLSSCYSDAGGLLSGVSSLKNLPQDNWLFICCMTLEKALVNNPTVYGYSNLAEETGISEIGSLGGVLVTPFLNLEKPLRPDILDAVSKVFSQKLKNIGRTKLSSAEFRKSMLAMLLQRQNYTLKVYRFYDPLGDLVKLSLSSKGIEYEEKMIATCFKEFAGAKAAKCKYISVGNNVLVYTLSCHGSHVYDKTKELSARFRATKAHWDGKQFSARRQAEYLLFVADGDWRDEDLKVLSESGADRIFYPNDIDALVSLVDSVAKVG